jgi:hypothetical protein
MCPDTCTEDTPCFKCKIKTIQVSPSATPSRTWRPQKGPKEVNSWEKGIPRDERGMPIIKSDGSPMGQKEYSEKRTQIEAAKRQLHNS